MPAAREQPYGSFHFRVEIGSGRSALRGGFTAVEFPPFVVPGAAAAVHAGETGAPALLVLRRAFTGSLDLCAWWDATRRAKRRAAGKAVRVDLLDEAGGEPVLSWRFSGCRPVALQHSPLDAQRSALLIESLSLSFEDVELG